MDTDRLLDLQASTAQIEAADRIATALVAGFDLCDEAGHGLSQVQRIELAKATLLVFDGFRSEVQAQLRVGAVLGSLADAGAGRRDAA